MWQVGKKFYYYYYYYLYQKQGKVKKLMHMGFEYIMLM